MGCSRLPIVKTSLWQEGNNTIYFLLYNNSDNTFLFKKDHYIPVSLLALRFMVGAHTRLQSQGKEFSILAMAEKQN